MALVSPTGKIPFRGEKQQQEICLLSQGWIERAGRDFDQNNLKRVNITELSTDCWLTVSQWTAGRCVIVFFVRELFFIFQNNS